jgi:hypothetical protein
MKDGVADTESKDTGLTRKGQAGRRTEETKGPLTGKHAFAILR